MPESGLCQLKKGGSAPKGRASGEDGDMVVSDAHVRAVALLATEPASRRRGSVEDWRSHSGVVKNIREFEWARNTKPQRCASVHQRNKCPRWDGSPSKSSVSSKCIHRMHISHKTYFKYTNIVAALITRVTREFELIELPYFFEFFFVYFLMSAHSFIVRYYFLKNIL